MMVAALTLVMAGSVVWRMTYLKPTWYTPPAADDRAAASLADRAEYRLVEEVQKVRPQQEEQWTLRVRESQINAWLATRLQAWLEHEQNGAWPAQLGTPQVHIQSTGISMAIPLLNATGKVSRIVVARMSPEMSDGALMLHIDRLALGRVILPGEPLTNLMRLLGQAAPQTSSEPQMLKALDILAGKRSINPIFKLADSRRVRLLNFHLDEGMVDFTARTIDTNLVRDWHSGR
jgi:hypothetical protein